jgi:hypothetical protein
MLRSVERPTSLNVIPTENLDEDEELDCILIDGWDRPPGVGSLCLVVPIKEGEQLRRIRWLYRVTETTATGEREWPWELGLELIPAPSPQRWYDLVDHMLCEGLVPLVGTYQSGAAITHGATIEAIFDLLGF